MSVELSKEGKELKAAMFLVEFFSEKQVVVEVTIDLDGIPGWGYYGEDMIAGVTDAIKDRLGHYNPVVKVIKNDRPQFPDMYRDDVHEMTDDEHVAAGHAFYNDPDGGHWEISERKA
jgi:hypothetical protein